MTLVESEVGKDGQSEITKVKENPLYKIESRPLGTDLPEVPSVADISKLFEPKFVAYIDLPDGSGRAAFTYKKIDPMTLIQTIGVPNSIDLHPVIALDRLNDKASALGIEIGSEEELQFEKDDPRIPDILALENGEEMQNMAKFNEHLRRETLKLCVISPPIDDALYDNLAEGVKEGLYNEISGGVTTNNEITENFREVGEAEAE